MTQYSIILLTLVLLSCKPTNQEKAKSIESSSETEKVEMTEIILTENKLGELEVDKLDESNMIQQFNYKFPSLNLKKTIGQQDGPDFNLYEISSNGKELLNISMDSDDTSRVYTLWTNNKIVKDQYGMTIGKKIEEALEKRTNLKFYSDPHQNIYAIEKKSKIEYQLSGDFISLNDSNFSAKDYTVEKWQVAKMEIECLIWRK